MKVSKLAWHIEPCCEPAVRTVRWLTRFTLAAFSVMPRPHHIDTNSIFWQLSLLPPPPPPPSLLPAASPFISANPFAFVHLTSHVAVSCSGSCSARSSLSLQVRVNDAYIKSIKCMPMSRTWNRWTGYRARLLQLTAQTACAPCFKLARRDAAIS